MQSVVRDGGSGLDIVERVRVRVTAVLECRVVADTRNGRSRKDISTETHTGERQNMDVMMTVLRHRVPQSRSARGRRQGENRSLHPPNVVPPSPCRPRISCPLQGSPFYRLQGRAQTIGVDAQSIWAKKRRSVVPEDWAICLQVRWPNRTGSGLMVFSRTVRLTYLLQRKHILQLEFPRRDSR